MRLTGLRYLALALTVSGLSGCIAHYNHEPLLPKPGDIPPSRMPAVISMEGDPLALKANWEEIGIRCTLVKSAMLREADALSTRQKVVGGAFALVGALLAASSAVYSAVATDPRREVTIVLGTAGGLIATPSIFFFGTDDREKDVRARRARIDAQESNVVAEYEALQAALVALDAARKARDEASPEDKANAQRAYNDAKASFNVAQKDLSIALIRLSSMCE